MKKLILLITVLFSVVLLAPSKVSADTDYGKYSGKHISQSNTNPLISKTESVAINDKIEAYLKSVRANSPKEDYDFHVYLTREYSTEEYDDPQKFANAIKDNLKISDNPKGILLLVVMNHDIANLYLSGSEDGWQGTDFNNSSVNKYIFTSGVKDDLLNQDTLNDTLNIVIDKVIGMTGTIYPVSEEFQPDVQKFKDWQESYKQQYQANKDAQALEDQKNAKEIADQKYKDDKAKAEQEAKDKKAAEEAARKKKQAQQAMDNFWNTLIAKIPMMIISIIIFGGIALAIVGVISAVKKFISQAAARTLTESASNMDFLITEFTKNPDKTEINSNFIHNANRLTNIIEKSTDKMYSYKENKESKYANQSIKDELSTYLEHQSADIVYKATVSKFIDMFNETMEEFPELKENQSSILVDSLKQNYNREQLHVYLESLRNEKNDYEK